MSDTVSLPQGALDALDLPPTQVPFPGASSLETSRGKVWVKTLEPPSRHYRRAVISGVSRVLPIPILRPSKAGKGGDTLLQQAAQAEVLRAADLPVPEVLYGDREFLILSDGGINIAPAVRYEEKREKLGLDKADLTRAIMVMTETLAALHAKGFAHGRPKIRDFGWRDGVATLLDLEERPWEVMPMATAQARDIFLWLIDLCSAPLSRPLAAEAMAVFSRTMSPETQAELRKLCRMLRPLAVPARQLAKTPLKNRELIGAAEAYGALRDWSKARL